MQISNIVDSFVRIEDQNLQIDFYRGNGQVILQVFKYSDVKKWGIGIDFGNYEGVVFELTFSKSKTNNEQVYMKFINSELFSQFKKFVSIKQDSFFSFIPFDLGNFEIEKFITTLLNELYGDETNIEIQLNSY